MWHTSWLARFLKLMLYHKVCRDMAVKKTTSFCFNDGSIESLQNTNLENIFTDSEPCYTFPPANIYRWYSSPFCFSLWCAPSVLTSIWSWNHIDYMPFHCGASQYESSNVFHLVMRIYIHCNHHGSVAFVMNLLRLLLTLQCTGDASVWCESSDCVQCCIWHHKDCIDGEKVLTQNNIK